MLSRTLAVIVLLSVVSTALAYGGRRGHRGPPPPSGERSFPPPHMIDFLVCLFNNTDVPSNFDFTKEAFEELFKKFNVSGAVIPCKPEGPRRGGHRHPPRGHPPPPPPGEGSFPPPHMIDFLVCLFHNTEVPSNFDFTKEAFEKLFEQANQLGADFPCKPKEGGHHHPPPPNDDPEGFPAPAPAPAPATNQNPQQQISNQDIPPQDNSSPRPPQGEGDGRRPPPPPQGDSSRPPPHGERDDRRPPPPPQGDSSPPPPQGEGDERRPHPPHRRGGRFGRRGGQRR